MSIPANISTLIFRLILLPALVWLNYIPIKRFLAGDFSNSDNRFILLIALPFFLYLLLVVSLSFSGFFNVNIDEQEKKITLKGFIKKNSFLVEMIEGYAVTRFKTRWKEYEGIVIKLKNGKTYELSEYNLDSLYHFNQYLIEQSITDLGKKKSQFPFKTRI